MITRPEPEVAVTLAPKLFERLRLEADLLGIPLEWLVASLVVDTIDEARSVPVAA